MRAVLTWAGVPTLQVDVVHPSFPLPSTASPTLLCALKDGFGHAVVAFDMPEPCKFPSLDSCQKRFLWTQKEDNLTPHPIVGHVLQVADAEKFLQAFRIESLGPFSQNVQEVSMSHNHRGERTEKKVKLREPGKYDG